ncbi:MAG: lipid-A-disaccharide synthase [Ignavibacteriales bacterium]|nr:lipid-A-disaccharide synthase [Ignavibacteriales bacterium]
MNKKLMIIAGEASGDLHGSALIAELKKIDKDIEVFGIGGDKMIQNGMKAIHHINEMSFLGFIEVIKHIPFIRKVKSELIELAKNEKIQHAVLIDYPGFNLSIAKAFHKFSMKNIYYISPQIWAWGKGRIEKIKKLINRMIVFFPFEEKLYKNNNVNSDFVGHPLIKSIHEFNFLSRDDLNKKYDLSVEKDLLILLPGSRKQEIDKILPSTLEASKKICNEFNMQTIVACADNIDINYFDKYKHLVNFKVIKGETYNLLKNANFAVIKSGTSTLEAGIIGTPFIVVYKTNYFTYLIGKLLIKIKNIALANIVAEKQIVKELIQNDVNPEKIYDVCSLFLSNKLIYENLKNDLKSIKFKLNTEGNPSKKAAEIIYAELNAV